jgi:hypothetical protein
MGEIQSETYHLFGLLVKSELPMPELITGLSAPNVFIQFAKIAEKIELPSVSGISYKNYPDKFLLKVEGIACFLVENGNRITIDRAEGGSDDEIRLFLLGSAFGALIHQRGILPLHGSAIVFNNQAIIFSGISGSGKSTLAAGFMKRGYMLLTDDVCVITLDKDGKPIAHPGYPQMKLWSDSLENLGQQTVTLRKIRGNIRKYALPIRPDFYNCPLPVKSIYVISANNNSSHVTLKPLTGVEKFNAINNNTYRLNFLKGGGSSVSHFNHIEAVSRQCLVRKLDRPNKGFYLDKLIEAIENDVAVGI